MVSEAIMTVGIDLHCGICGGNNLRLERASTDDSVVTCQDCGTIVGTLGTLKEEVTEQLGRQASLGA